MYWNFVGPLLVLQTRFRRSMKSQIGDGSSSLGQIRDVIGALGYKSSSMIDQNERNRETRNSRGTSLTKRNSCDHFVCELFG